MFGRKDNKEKVEMKGKDGDNYFKTRREQDEDRFNYHINHLSTWK